METTQQFFAIVFADVSGSTRLYEQIGNRAAQEAISQVLNAMVAIVTRHQGILVKTIGDEILCRFPTADQAVRAGITIQEAMQDGLIPTPTPMGIRIGMQWGPVILENQDVFGDAVNVAARMAGIAKAGQIITTFDTVRALSTPDLASKTRLFDVASVKGKQDTLVIYEVVWEEEENVTRITSVAPDVTAEPLALQLTACGNAHTLKAGDSLSLGRSDQCDITIPSPLASRLHAKIEYRRGKFILLDQSTNGSYVRTEDGQTVHLRREELPLWGSGLIALGEDIDEGSPHLVHFRL